MDEDQESLLTIEIAKPKIPFWQRLGGTSLTIALVVHLIALIIGAIWIFQVIYPPEKQVDFMPPGGGGGERGAETKVNTKKRQQITPTTNVKRVFAEGAESNFSIPDPGDNFGEMSALSSLSSGGASGGLGGSGSGGGFGSGSGSGSGLGMGNGSGKLFGLIPDNMRKRCTKEDRLQRLKENGGTPACEEAVLKGLRWLKANQNSDGSFGSSNKEAMTGLVLLAYLGHCETPDSQEFGESCLKAIVYLVDHGMKNSGRLGGNPTAQPFCYEHAIATYALGEAYTFCREFKINIPNLPEITEQAGQFIIDNQHNNGGWSYNYAKEGGHTDVSVVGWQIQALKACSHTPIKYKGLPAALTKGLRYLETCQDPKGGAFGYEGPPAPDAASTLTGVGMLCFQMCDKGKSSQVTKGARSVLKNLNFEYAGKSGDLYQHYYESQAMMQRGGDDWKKYNEVFRDQILNNQNPDGSWKTPGGQNHGGKDPVYFTSLSTLMLEVYYRFLNTSGAGGGIQRQARKI